MIKPPDRHSPFRGLCLIRHLLQAPGTSHLASGLRAAGTRVLDAGKGPQVYDASFCAPWRRLSRTGRGSVVSGVDCREA